MFSVWIITLQSTTGIAIPFQIILQCSYNNYHDENHILKIYFEKKKKEILNKFLWNCLIFIIMWVSSNITEIVDILSLVEDLENISKTPSTSQFQNA